MPRAAKPKNAGSAAVPAKKPAAGKKNKLYAMPEKIKEGTILTDLARGQWRIGPSIGIGGFGEIYAACRVGEKNNDAVVKCEPHGNGPLFVEMHFYLRNAKLDDIKKFKEEHRLKSLGMPHILANGSADINGQKHRFIVMPRFGSDVAKFYTENGKRLPEATVYRLALQMLDAYEFIHSKGFVHADLKAANILLGLGKGGAAQAYLVDFGLASHYVTGDFKPDPKKMHNGTIEYTSRDAHLGVPTRRADLEILGYNLVEWLGVELPWVKDKLLTSPPKVQKAKEKFMDDVGVALKQLFSKGVPASITEYMKYVAKLSHNEAPDYKKCRDIFLNALKQIKVANSGDLDFKLRVQGNNNSSPSTSKPAATKPARGKAAIKKEDSPTLIDSTDDEVCASDEELNEKNDSMFEPHRRLKSTKLTPTRRVTPKSKKTAASPKNRAAGTAPTATSPAGHKRDSSGSTPSPRKRTSAGITPQRSPIQKKRQKTTDSAATPKPADSVLSLKNRTPSSGINAKINFSPALSIRGKPGKTVVNDDLTPNPRSNKTYEFNFELDVSMDANVIVNVKRKKKAKQEANSVRAPSRLATTSNGDTPVTRVNLRKLNEEGSSSSPGASTSRSPRTPGVTVRKYRH